MQPVLPGHVRTQKFISRADVQANLGTVYVFGDNMERRGMGGQAKAMRGEPNTIGIPTKWTPGHNLDSDYFTDADINDIAVSEELHKAFVEIWLALQQGRDVVLPEDGVGTGLAELSTRAPKMLAYINQQLDLLKEHYP